MGTFDFYGSAVVPRPKTKWEIHILTKMLERFSI
jgi:hypothetical protein